MIRVAGRTDVGLVREHNEDSFVVVDLARRERLDVEDTKEIPLGRTGALFLVCDGMGGAAAGEVASAMAIEAVSDAMTTPVEGEVTDGEGPERLADFARRLRSAAFSANRLIFEASRADHAQAGMGTTMTSVGALDDNLVMAQVGDSRTYVLRGDKLTQVTRDQSLVNQLLETGQITEEQARMFEHSNVILQALGVQPDVEVLLSRVPLRAGDRFAVCSDGLTGPVSDEEISAILGSIADPAEACRVLIEMARSGGGPDNITVIVGYAEGAGLMAPRADEVLTYERWRLDEHDQDVASPSGASSTMATPPIAAPRVDLAQLFFSSMVLLALGIGGFVISALLMRTSPQVACLLATPAPGLSIRVDGRDVGARTRAGTTPLRLPPGRHRLALRGHGAPAYDRVVEAASSGGACSARFDTEEP